MRKRLQDILHKYKVEAFKVGHPTAPPDSLTKEVLTFSQEALKNAFHYHFHKLPDANRAEIINMINNYVTEAILPPVVEKIMRRVVALEKQHKALVDAINAVCEELSEEEKKA